MIVEAATPDLTQYTAQYELLRSQVIGSARNSPRKEDAADQPRGVGPALLPSDIDARWRRSMYRSGWRCPAIYICPARLNSLDSSG